MPKNATIGEIMTKDVFTVELEDLVRKADEIMRIQKIRHVPVVDNKKIIGLITDRGLIEYTLRRIYDYEDNVEDSGKNKIMDFESIMNKEVQLIYPEDTVQKAVQLMVKKKIDCLLVVDWDKNLIGIITTYDILLFFNKKMSEEKPN
ncbi:MAG: CBS domain-containing protein [Bacteroidota bacterium]